MTDHTPTIESSEDALAERIRELDAEPAERKRLREAVRILGSIVPTLPDSDTLLLAPETIDAWRMVRDHDSELYLVYLSTVRRACGRHIADLVQERIGARAVASEGWPEPIDLAMLASREPQAPQHIIPGFLPQGEVALAGGHGGVGKSAILLHLGACIALGRRWCGLEVARRPVYYISCEDGRDVLHWRLSRIAQHLAVPLDGELSDWLHVIDATRIEPELMIEIGRGEEPILTALYTELAERVSGDPVIVLDGASDLYGASEIVRRHVRRFIRALRRLAGERGAVVLIAHIDKAAARSRESGDRYSGSTAWHNSVRARWELRSDPDSDELVLALAKANHAQAGAEIRFRWDATAHMHLPVVAAPADGGIVASIRERTEREAILAALRGCMRADPPIQVPSALTGRRTTWHVLSERPEFPAALRSAERDTRTRFARHLELLRQSGAIEEQSVLTAARHRIGILVARAVRQS